LLKLPADRPAWLTHGMVLLAAASGDGRKPLIEVLSKIGKS